MTPPKFLYIADPMCSWCYGFSPELRAFLSHFPNYDLDIVLGGLRAYQTQPLDDTMRDMLYGHWDKVAQVSGLAFDRAALRRPNFIYDTEPACRAVVTAKLLADDLPAIGLLDVFQAISHAFYAQARDITDETELADILTAALNAAAGDEHYDRTSLKETLTAAATREETRLNFEQIQRWGIRGFPMLLLVTDGGLQIVANGYGKAEQLLKAWAELDVSQ
ncbi:MAG: DsbA family protein [Burkholderiales bacterium]|nr:DsbA family protein [Burkholderiales bacterium]